MARHEIALDGARSIEVVVQGDLVVAGGDLENAILDDDADEFAALPIVRQDDVIRAEVRGDARLSIPRHLALRIERVDGDLRAQDLGAQVDINRVNGDANLQRIDGAISGETIMGDLRIREAGGDSSFGHVAGDFHAERIRGSVRLSEPVDGDLDLSDIAEDVVVETIHGDLSVQGCGRLRAATVDGDAHAEDVRGEIRIDRINGDAKLEACQGMVTLDNVSGDLSGSNLAAGLKAPNVDGDIRLRTAFAPGTTYEARAHGSARLTLIGEPGQVSVRFDLHTHSGRIASDLPLDNAERTPTRLRGQLGDGAAQVQVNSDGPITLTGRESGFDWGSMGNLFGDISKDFADVFGAFAGTGSGEFEGRLRDRAEKIGRRAEEAARKAGERAQRHAERMAREAERQGQRWGSGAGGWWRPPGTPPPAPPRPVQPAPPRGTSSEERLLILRMLSDGKISAEEAARLLDALG